ncbi:MAG: DNA-3-methyladenine glycosylase family protein [Acutalibacteraceae bacterium]
MVVSFTPAGTVLTGAALDIRKTFDCGQCFRFAPDGGGYTGVAFGRVLHVTQDGGSIMLHGVDRAAYEAVWADYFDLARDYEALSDAFCGDEALRTAYAFSRGIRILAQDPWETLCSFILSQNNNIPRIRKIIASLCERFGAPIAGTPFYAFPPPSGLPKPGWKGWRRSAAASAPSTSRTRPLGWRAARSTSKRCGSSPTKRPKRR